MWGKYFKLINQYQCDQLNQSIRNTNFVLFTKRYQKIYELMDHLEQRKTEAILFTFRQVTKYFSEVFKIVE